MPPVSIWTPGIPTPSAPRWIAVIGIAVLALAIYAAVVMIYGTPAPVVAAMAMFWP
jgi:hypothetical protein